MAGGGAEEPVAQLRDRRGARRRARPLDPRRSASPPGGDASPIAKTEAPPVALLPRGSSAPSASALTAGIPSSPARPGSAPAPAPPSAPPRRSPPAGSLRRPASPPPDAGPPRSPGRPRAPRRRRWRPGRRRRPGSCSWSRRRDSRALRASPRTAGVCRLRLASAADQRGGAAARSRRRAAADDRGDDEDRGDEDRSRDQLQRQRHRSPRPRLRPASDAWAASSASPRALAGFAFGRRSRPPERPHLSASLWPHRKATAGNWLAGQIRLVD